MVDIEYSGNELHSCGIVFEFKNLTSCVSVRLYHTLYVFEYYYFISRTQ